MPSGPSLRTSRQNASYWWVVLWLLGSVTCVAAPHAASHVLVVVSPTGFVACTGKRWYTLSNSVLLSAPLASRELVRLPQAS